MPIGLATAVTAGAAVLGAGATIYASSKSSHAQTQAAQTASNTEAQTAAANNQLARDMYASNAARLDPYSNMGLAAGDDYMGLLVGHAPASAPGGTSPNGWVTYPPAPSSALGSAVQQHANQAIAAGANPDAVWRRIAALGGSFG